MHQRFLITALKPVHSCRLRYSSTFRNHLSVRAALISALISSRDIPCTPFCSASFLNWQKAFLPSSKDTFDGAEIPNGIRFSKTTFLTNILITLDVFKPTRLQNISNAALSLLSILADYLRNEMIRITAQRAMTIFQRVFISSGTFLLFINHTEQSTSATRRQK